MSKSLIKGVIDLSDIMGREMWVWNTREDMAKRKRVIATMNGSYMVDDGNIVLYSNAKDLGIFPFNLQPYDAQRIIDSSCGSLKKRLIKLWSNNIRNNESMIVSEEFCDKLYKWCEVDQIELIESIFDL